MGKKKNKKLKASTENNEIEDATIVPEKKSKSKKGKKVQKTKKLSKNSLEKVEKSKGKKGKKGKKPKPPKEDIHYTEMGDDVALAEKALLKDKKKQKKLKLKAKEQQEHQEQQELPLDEPETKTKGKNTKKAKGKNRSEAKAQAVDVSGIDLSIEATEPPPQRIKATVELKFTMYRKNQQVKNDAIGRYVLPVEKGIPPAIPINMLEDIEILEE